MPKLDARMYGADDNDFAERIASDSLCGQPNSGHEDYWKGDPNNDDSLVSKANVGEESMGPANSIPKLNKFSAGNTGDKEKFRMPPQWSSSTNRHKPGPTASTGHDYEDALVPKNHTNTTKTDNPQTDLFSRPSQTGKRKGS